MKKNNKFIIAILLALVMACVFVACSHADKEDGKMITVTEAVTDETGEVVTDAQGEVVTEVTEGEAQTTNGGEIVTEVVTNKKKEPFTHRDGGYVTRVVVKTTRKSNTTTKKSDTTTKKGKTTTTKKGKTTTTKKGETTKPTTTVVKQPDAPGKVSGFKVSSITKDTAKLTWDKLKCDGYEIQYYADGKEGDSEQIFTTKTSETIKNLISYTNYTFRIRGYNEYADGKKYATNNWVEVKATTKADENYERQINVECLLPVTGKADTLIIYVKEKGGEYKKDSEVKIDSCDGMTHTYQTKNKYKGLVQVRVVLKKANTENESALTDKDTISLDLTNTRIGMAEGIDD